MGTLLLLLLLAGAVVAGLLLGAAPLAPGEVWRALVGLDTDASTRTIVLSLRLQIGRAHV